MKSTRKTVYNHRIAHNKSKEDWETKFVSMLDASEEDVANNLLYLAATKEFSAGKSDYNIFYTESNRDRLISKIKEIANNPYNLKNHPKFEKNIQAAIEKLDEKIKKNSEAKPDGSSDSSGTKTDNATNIEYGTGSSTTTPGMPDPVTVPDLATDRKPEPGKTYFKPDYREAFRDLEYALDYPKRYPLNKALEIRNFIQTEFLNKYPGDEYIAGFRDNKGPYPRIRKFNTKINNYNNKWQKTAGFIKIPLLVVLPLSI
jgi:hypothetical protein